MKLLVVGAGAVGGYYAAMLSRAGHDVTVVARGEHGRAIREHGLVVDIPGGTLTATPTVVGDVKDAESLGADVAIVAVKAASLLDVAEGTGKALAKDGFAIPLLNGLDSETELAAVIGAGRVIGGIAQIASLIAGPGHIHVDAPAKIVLAPLSPGQMTDVERIAAEFARAGFECEAKPDLSRILWTKLLWNAPFNAICALTDRSAGEVLAVPELAALVRDTMEELARVALADGVTIDERLIAGTLDATRTKFSDSRPSMLQDMRNGRPTEASALQGAVVRRGEKHGVATPIHRTLLALVLGKSANRSGLAGA
ncbi:MAG TPA: ketopantoate reductase family protein [Polyangiaceae bacterium]|jgi:2-dehydropantoate 2-reductase|nr:ketopantoate reductase family protein [Polyangiaceae bacterium]